jgi:plastocyanin
VQQLVVTSADGGLANVLVDLQGSFPASQAPGDPVVINQTGCVYSPRVVGARVGQTLRVVNNDALLHEVHSVSVKGNTFDTTQPKSGMVFNYQLKSEEAMLKLGCRVHSWMTAYVGVLTHPYFAVSGDGGSFTIANVPAGKYTIRTWHERFGRLMKTVDVTAGGTATVTFEYTGTEKPATAGIRDLLVPLDDSASGPLTLSQARSSAPHH